MRDGLTAERELRAATAHYAAAVLDLGLPLKDGLDVLAASRQQLEQHLYSWGQEVDSNAVEVRVHHLRRKLGADLIQTVRGVGYVLLREAAPA